MTITFKVEGFKELRRKLDELRTAKLAAKVLAAAMRKAFAPVLESARAMVPVDEGLLRESLSIKLRTSKRDDTIQVGLRIGGGARSKQAAAAGAAFGAGSEVPPARRWHFVEFGTANMAAHPFLRPALDSNAARVLELLRAELAAALAKGKR
ncbi:MAG: HK97-gp10 family putative phage morphogenesis protein [Patescibacteria group bacterium]